MRAGFGTAALAAIVLSTAGCAESFATHSPVPAPVYYSATPAWSMPAMPAPPAAYLTDAAAPEPITLTRSDGAPVEVIFASVPGRRPVVVGLHGSNMVPSWSCGFMWEAFRGAATLVCPAGDRPTIRPKSNGFRAHSWSSAAAAHSRSMEALSVMIARFPERLDLRSVVLSTYSQSAYLAPAIAARGGFRAAMIWEGFTGELDPKTAKALPPGLRVALVPATANNLRTAEAQANSMRRAGVAVQLVYPGSVGHGFAHETRSAMRAAVPGLVGGLPGW